MRFNQFIFSTNIGIPDDLTVVYDRKVFKKMVDFIVSLNPAQLTPQQIDNIVDIIQLFNIVPIDEDTDDGKTVEMIKKNKDKINNWYSNNVKRNEA